MVRSASRRRHRRWPSGRTRRRPVRPTTSTTRRRARRRRSRWLTRRCRRPRSRLPRPPPRPSPPSPPAGDRRLHDIEPELSGDRDEVDVVLFDRLRRAPGRWRGPPVEDRDARCAGQVRAVGDPGLAGAEEVECDGLRDDSLVGPELCVSRCCMPCWASSVACSFSSSRRTSRSSRSTMSAASTGSRARPTRRSARHRAPTTAAGGSAPKRLR